MARRLCSLLIALMLVVPVLAGARGARAAECVTFPETGQSLCDLFLQYWRANGGLPVFGYPITPAQQEVNIDTKQSYLTQWFERNRFEYHPDYAGTKDEIMLGHLAREVLIRRGWIKRDS